MSFAGEVLSWVLAVAQGGQGDLGEGGGGGGGRGEGVARCNYPGFEVTCFLDLPAVKWKGRRGRHGGKGM